jgi:hypothetical protein
MSQQRRVKVIFTYSMEYSASHFYPNVKQTFVQSWFAQSEITSVIM